MIHVDTHNKGNGFIWSQIFRDINRTNARICNLLNFVFYFFFTQLQLVCMYVINAEQERREILKRYRELLNIWNKGGEERSHRMVRKAFNLAVTAHKDMRRKSGEPYIYHPIEVARIVAE
jgi:hypothetical protein